MILCFYLSFCAATSSVNAASSRADAVGINHDFIWTDEEVWETLADWMAESGVTWCRIPIRWVTVEPDRGRWDFSRADRVVRILRERDIRILGILMSVPSWANKKKPGEVEGWYDAYPPDSLDDWGNYVRETVGRYRGDISHWEVWNEENGVDFFRPMPDAGVYVDLLNTAYEACKEANPESVVVLGGLQMNGIIANPWSPVKIENFLQKIYDAGGKPYFDVGNIHPYILSSDPIEKMVEMIHGTIEVMERNGDGEKPVWITEVGCGTQNDPDGTMQAALLESTFREALRIQSVTKVFWFTLRDYPHDIVGPESSMGVLTVDLDEKPAAEALRNMVRSFGSGARTGKRGTGERRIEALKGEEKMGEYKVVFEDDFQSHEIGAKQLPGWEFESGEWEIVRDGDRKVLAQKRPFGDNMYALTKESYSGDYVLEADVKMVETNRWGCGLVSRYQNDGDLYQFEMWDVHPFVRFWVWKDYHYETPGGADFAEPMKLGQWYHMTLSAEGTKHTCTLSPGDIRFEAEDAAYREGRIGLNAAGVIYFDNVKLMVR